MNAELTKDDLVNLVKSITPSSFVANAEPLRGLGELERTEIPHKGMVMSVHNPVGNWIWDTDALSYLSEERLWDVYKYCKGVK
jgi:hypothetical protein